MKLLRETIKRLLLENNRHHYPKLMKLLNGTNQDVTQALELAEAIGLISIESQNSKMGEHWKTGMPLMTHFHLFVCLEPEFFEYIQDNHTWFKDHTKMWFFNADYNWIKLQIEENGGV